MRQVTVVKITKEPAPSTRVRVRFSDKHTMEFSSPAVARREIRQWLDEMNDPEFLRRLALAWWAARDDQLSDVSLIEGKTLTVAIETNNPMGVG